MNILLYIMHEEKRSFKCELCDYRFYEIGSLDKHIVSINEEKKQFPCEFCNIIFSGKGNLDRHVVVEHEGKLPFNCKHYDKSSSEKSKMI